MKRAKSLKSREDDIKQIWKRIKTRDFSGNTGLAVKNSIYQVSTNFTAKFGSLIFTAILARILMPELFGLYSLALSTILIFAAFSNLGTSEILIRFLSKNLHLENKSKAKAYAFYIGKIKLSLIFGSILILFISAKFISQTYYQKPLFLALIAGTLFIFFRGIVRFIEDILVSLNYFKGVFFKEIFFEVSRLILVPFFVLYVLKKGFASDINTFFIIFAISFSYLLTAVFVFFAFRKKLTFFKEKKYKFNKKQTKHVNKFVWALSATALSGMFFSYIDMVMLGHFVLADFIGYYKAALSLIGAFSSLIGFSAVLLPIFSRLDKKRAGRALSKSIKLISTFSLIIIIFILLLSPLLISLVYGNAYSPSSSILRILAIWVLATPLIALYKTYFISTGKPYIIAKLLIAATLLNILLNYVFISWLINYGNLAGVYGAAIATLISKYLLLGGFIFYKKKSKK